MRLFAGFFVGLLWSNWIEYAFHRWAMHWPSLYQPAAIRHVLHHSAPFDPRHITMTFKFWSVVLTLNVLLFALPDQLLHLHILTGVVAAFVTYIALGVEVHLRIHDGRWVPDAWRAHHLLHHVRPQQNFNIFLPVFDWLLGSKISLFPVRSMSWAQRREYSRRRREKWRNYSEKNN
jgi:Fatty acid hydroxylase superfamily